MTRPRITTAATLATLLAAPFAQAAPLTWDANGTGTGQTNGGGAWLGANLWWNGSTNQNWVSGSDATLGGPTTAGGAITLASSTSVGSITFNTFTGTYTLGSAGEAITLDNGLTINAASGSVSLTASPIVLSAAQTWTNHSGNALTSTTGVNNGGFTLTLDGPGGFNFSGTSSIITGAGGLTKNGTGRLTLGSGGTIPAHDYAGTTTLNGGVTMVSNNNLSPGNLTLNGGVVESYWATNFIRPLGAGVGQVRITGGASGFSLNGATGMSVIFGNSATNEVVWGSTTFNPSTLVLQAPSAQAGSGLGFANRIDLNGANRSIAMNGTAPGVTATISGVIRNSSATAAGLTKTGPGLLVFTAANTYDGGTTINQGTLRFADKNTMPAGGNVTVNDGATLSVGVGTGNLWTTSTIGNATIGGLLGGLGGQSGGTVSYSGNVNLELDVASGTQAYAGDIINVGTSLGLIKSNAGTLVLSGDNSYSGKTTVHGGTLSFASIGNVGGGDSTLGAPTTIANGTLNVGYRATAGILRYTGPGHTSNRVINLAGTTAGVTLDASGSGALVLTSAPTATGVGAKTFTLTGTNTAANTLPATALPGLADVLTVQKSGAGTWWLGGFSSPKNAWTVSAGTLVVIGGITTGDQQVTVSGGTLAGTGPITLQATKSLIVQAAGSLAPGNLAVGTLAVTGKLDISGMAGGSGKLDFQIAAPAASDKITVTGTAQIGSGLLGFNDFVFTDLGGMTSSTYVLLTATGGIAGTLDPANRMGTIGSIAGALQINGNNLEFTVDQDLDGMPDVYELANTVPPSATSLYPNADLENGGAGDGLTNLQEYLLGTNPDNPDTDADGLVDGVETRTGIFVSNTNSGTNPLVLDSDGDALRDGYETNTGIFASATNTGTNPNKRDSDNDALRDNVETNTGTVVSRTNTGTNPNLPDTDNDGAGDWYEVTASFTSPFLAGEKPNVPYPLPDPDASTGVTNKPVKVYIMSGQSNMVGIGYISGGNGSLDTITKSEQKFPNLVNASNAYTTRNDVRYRGVVTAVGNGLLTPGVGNPDRLGPELGFGHVMGHHHDEPVLLLKASQGNRGLFWDILPPASPRFTSGGTVYAGYGEGPNSWAVGSGPSPFIWYAGKQYDDFFKAESDMGLSNWAAGVNYQASGLLGTQVFHNGVAYICKLSHTSGSNSEPGAGSFSSTYWGVYSIENVTDVLDNFAAQYPQWAVQGFEIAGYVWFQGNWDLGSTLAAGQYRTNLVRFIKQTRSYYANRYSGKCSTTTPFVLATGCGDPGTSGNGLVVANAQLAVDGAAKTNEALNYPEFAGNVKTMDTRGYWRELDESPGSQGYHYNNNAETYLLTGDALGRGMIDLLASTTGNTYAKWIGTYPGAAAMPGFDQDADADGIDNGAENFFGTNPGSFSGGLLAGTSNGSTFTFTHPQNATPATGVSAVYRWSKDLTTFRNGGRTDGDGTTVNFNAVTNAGITTVTATITGTTTARLFVDVKVIQN